MTTNTIAPGPVMLDVTGIELTVAEGLVRSAKMFRPPARSRISPWKLPAPMADSALPDTPWLAVKVHPWKRAPDATSAGRRR